MFQNHYNACAIDMLEHILCQVSIYQQHSIIERTSDWKSKVLNKSLSAVWGWDFNTHLWKKKKKQYLLVHSVQPPSSVWKRGQLTPFQSLKQILIPVSRLVRMLLLGHFI